MNRAFWLLQMLLMIPVVMNAPVDQRNNQRPQRDAPYLVTKWMHSLNKSKVEVFVLESKNASKIPNYTYLQSLSFLRPPDGDSLKYRGMDEKDPTNDSSSESKPSSYTEVLIRKKVPSVAGSSNTSTGDVDQVSVESATSNSPEDARSNTASATSKPSDVRNRRAVRKLGSGTDSKRYGKYKRVWDLKKPKHSKHLQDYYSDDYADYNSVSGLNKPTYLKPPQDYYEDYPEYNSGSNKPNYLKQQQDYYSEDYPEYNMGSNKPKYLKRQQEYYSEDYPEYYKGDPYYRDYEAEHPDYYLEYYKDRERKPPAYDVDYFQEYQPEYQPDYYGDYDVETPSSDFAYGPGAYPDYPELLDDEYTDYDPMYQMQYRAGDFGNNETQTTQETPMSSIEPEWKVSTDANDNQTTLNGDADEYDSKNPKEEEDTDYEIDDSDYYDDPSDYDTADYASYGSKAGAETDFGERENEDDDDDDDDDDYDDDYYDHANFQKAPDYGYDDDDSEDDDTDEIYPVEEGRAYRRAPYANYPAYR